MASGPNKFISAYNQDFPMGEKTFLSLLVFFLYKVGASVNVFRPN